MTLSACSTIPEHPVVINKECVPPSEIMIKHDALPKLQTPLTVKYMLEQWADDTHSYNNLNIEHSALIDWVNKNCK